MPNTNVPNINVPKWLWRGGVRPNWDNVLKYGFFFILKASLTFYMFTSVQNHSVQGRIPFIVKHSVEVFSDVFHCERQWSILIRFFLNVKHYTSRTILENYQNW